MKLSAKFKKILCSGIRATLTKSQSLRGSVMDCSKNLESKGDLFTWSPRWDFMLSQMANEFCAFDVVVVGHYFSHIPLQ